MRQAVARSPAAKRGLFRGFTRGGTHQSKGPSVSRSQSFPDLVYAQNCMPEMSPFEVKQPKPELFQPQSCQTGFCKQSLGRRVWGVGFIMDSLPPPPPCYTPPSPHRAASVLLASTQQALDTQQGLSSCSSNRASAESLPKAYRARSERLASA